MQQFFNFLELRKINFRYWKKMKKYPPGGLTQMILLCYSYERKIKRRLFIMKVILCGKGGCGKSTVSALIAGAYLRNGKNVLVVDTDESNFGLHKQLGLPLPEDLTHYFGGKMNVMKRKNEGIPLFEKPWTLADIPEAYSVKDGNLRLMAIGKIAEAGEGCACPMGFLTGAFLENLILSEDDVVIVDAEAGVEHFGRGVDSHTDVILMMVDPSYESIHLSEKIYEMGTTFGKPVYFVLNKMDAAQAQIVSQALKYTDAVITVVPQDNEVLMAGLKGEKITKTLPEIDAIIEKLK